jgi:hypothetical protein
MVCVSHSASAQEGYGHGHSLSRSRKMTLYQFVLKPWNGVSGHGLVVTRRKVLQCMRFLLANVLSQAFFPQKQCRCGSPVSELLGKPAARSSTLRALVPPAQSPNLFVHPTLSTTKLCFPVGWPHQDHGHESVTTGATSKNQLPSQSLEGLRFAARAIDVAAISANPLAQPIPVTYVQFCSVFGCTPKAVCGTLGRTKTISWNWIDHIHAVTISHVIEALKPARDFVQPTARITTLHTAKIL